MREVDQPVEAHHSGGTFYRVHRSEYTVNGFEIIRRFTQCFEADLDVMQMLFTLLQESPAVCL